MGCLCYVRPKSKMAGDLINLLLLDEVLDENFEDVDDEIAVLAAASTFTRRNLNRTQGFFEVVVPTYTPDIFSSHFRMTRAMFADLCCVISRTGRINTNNEFGRQPIPLEKQVLAFLWFASNTEVIRSVSDRFDVTLSSMHRIIKRVSKALVDVRQDYIKWPIGIEMNEIMTNFEAMGGMPGFPRVIGIIDCTHIRIKAPTEHPEAYVNRKKFHSLNTQAVCDDNMLFRDVVVGWPGSVHDGRILRNSTLYLNAAAKFPGDTHLLGDGGYPLLRWLMTPFRNNGHLNARQGRFNTKLSCIRQIVERSFILLKGRWRRLLSVEHTDVTFMAQIIMSTFVLHNFCLLHDDFDDGYFLDGNDGDGYQDGQGEGVNNRVAQQKRLNLMNIVA